MQTLVQSTCAVRSCRRLLPVVCTVTGFVALCFDSVLEQSVLEAAIPLKSNMAPSLPANTLHSNQSKQ